VSGDISQYFVARQPIFDRDLHVRAYELLFRSSSRNAAPRDLDAVAATAEVLSTAEDAGLDTLVGPHDAFVNISDRFLDEPDLLGLTSKQVVLEILETVEFTPERIEGLRQLRDRGFTLALDDFIYDESFEAIFPLVSIVKLEISAIPRADWASTIAHLKDRGLTVLAEKIETNEEFEVLRDLGCDLFQGYFFARPAVLSGRRVAANHLALVQLLAQINRASSSIDELSSLVARDLALSMRVLNHVNSAACRLNRRVESIHEAVVYLGRDQVRNLASLMLMTRVDRKPSELMVMALVRARLCETVAREQEKPNADAYFTAGLFSVLDALLDRPMEELLAELKLTEELIGALGERAGPVGRVLSIVIGLERGAGIEADAVPGSTPARLAELHREAVVWADTVARETDLAS